MNNRLIMARHWNGSSMTYAFTHMALAEMFATADEDIMLYTGMTDDNKKTIFGGDIVKIDGDKAGVYEVELLEVGAYGVAGKSFDVLFREYDCRKVEVIGNIYESKQLLCKANFSDLMLKALDLKTKTIIENVFGFTKNEILVEGVNGVFSKPINEVMLLQSIGIKDRDGKDIFEGDIVDIYDEDGDKIRNEYEVRNMQTFFEDKGFYAADGEDWKSENLKIVGNIYKK